MAVGEVLSYKLPPWADPEGNDQAVVYLDYMEA